MSRRRGWINCPGRLNAILGGINGDWLLAADLIVASPGVALAHPILSEAVEAGIEIVGDIELFCREAQAPIVAITGSNGKSTVTTLVGEMAKAAGWQVGRRRQYWSSRAESAAVTGATLCTGTFEFSAGDHAQSESRGGNHT
ncbi:UDP-N-acetylmuramoylalanine--D-glutamate ligase [Pantoea agglomerans]|uniref:UDP-N-acetylmuramoylalanine--D-glutamate ligase n=1 Tax=Enterobacter agglomerans TaxID=549 RepID=A0A379AKJ6_ENTAG|nr:UDP-N-acetylmuramoylalanine--D-glutamate ligase [Pantoea agglomerans]